MIHNTDIAFQMFHQSLFLKQILSNESFTTWLVGAMAQEQRFSAPTTLRAQKLHMNLIIDSR